MVPSTAIYQGEKHCLLTHLPSGSSLETDAPKDNQGRGERFSPTDLMAAALSSCALTTMAIVGEKKGLSLTGAKAHIEKHMHPEPRRIAKLVLNIDLPASLSARDRDLMEQTARNCPVKRSLSAEVEVEFNFHYGV